MATASGPVPAASGQVPAASGQVPTASVPEPSACGLSEHSDWAGNLIGCPPPRRVAPRSRGWSTTLEARVRTRA